jgi:acyl carrier protein
MAPRDTVFETILQVCAEKGNPRTSLNESDPLGDGGLGLDSLDMATIVAELDAKLDLDPFAKGVPSFRTVGEFVRLFEDGSSS